MRSKIGMLVLVVWVLVLSSEISAQERWVYTYNGARNWSDAAHSIVMGPDGNIYGAGSSLETGLYDDFTIVSLTPWGGERWVYCYDGPGDHSDGALSIVVGPDSSLYAAGYSSGTGTYDDFTVVSLTPWGGERSVYRYNGPGNATDVAYSIVMGADGNLYAAGTSNGGGTVNDFIVISLDTGGVERWVYRYDGPGSNDDRANSIVMGADGNLYAAGVSSGSGTSSDFTVVSVTRSGDERWVYRKSGPGGNQDAAYSIVAGADGYIYAAGTIRDTLTLWDLTVIGFDSLGTERWVYQYDDSLNGNDVAYSIVMGTDGNLYAAGRSTGSGNNTNLIVVSLDSSGTERWVYRHDGAASHEDRARSIVSGEDGNLYVAGESRTSGPYVDFTILSLTPSGDERWVYKYDGSASHDDRAYSVIMGADGNLYAAGCSEEAARALDFTVVSLNPNTGVAQNIHGPHSSLTLAVSASPVPAFSRVNICYSLPKAGEVRLCIYDSSGGFIKDLVNSRVESGSKVAVWNCRDASSKRVASGTYFIQLKAGDSYASAKIIVF